MKIDLSVSDLSESPFPTEAGLLRNILSDMGGPWMFPSNFSSDDEHDPDPDCDFADNDFPQNGVGFSSSCFVFNDVCCSS